MVVYFCWIVKTESLFNLVFSITTLPRKNTGTLFYVKRIIDHSQMCVIPETFVFSCTKSPQIYIYSKQDKKGLLAFFCPSLFVLLTVEYLINVHEPLLFSGLFITLHSLIRSCIFMRKKCSLHVSSILHPA